MPTKTTTKKKTAKMTAAGLERRIRTAIKRFKIKLKPGLYFRFDRKTDIKIAYLYPYVPRSPRFQTCAIGAALAYAKKDKAELAKLVYEIENGNGPTYEMEAARILNHGLTERDMIQMENGFEDRGFGDDQDPFFQLGRKLRQEAIGKDS